MASKDKSKRKTGKLKSKSIFIFGKRTSIKLDRHFWVALKAIASRENANIEQIVSLIFLIKEDDLSLTSAVRSFILLYFKASSTEEGHREAEHGTLLSKVSQMEDYFDLIKKETIHPSAEKRE